MSKVAFRVAERLSSSYGDTWTKYLEWSGLKHVTEVVGFDASLCFSTLGQSLESDWPHRVFGEHLDDCFDDHEYLAQRVGESFDKHLHRFLAVAREASADEVSAVDLAGFRFMGFELIDEATSTSALTNCGGFEGAFKNGELTSCGLVKSASRAYAIRDSLATKYPSEPHAQCAVWALWRRETA